MNLLKYLIESSGLNQAQFSKKVGRNPQHINRQIKSGGKMGFDSLVEYAEIVGIEDLKFAYKGYQVEIILKQNNHLLR